MLPLRNLPLIAGYGPRLRKSSRQRVGQHGLCRYCAYQLVNTYPDSVFADLQADEYAAVEHHHTVNTLQRFSCTTLRTRFFHLNWNVSPHGPQDALLCLATIYYRCNPWKPPASAGDNGSCPVCCFFRAVQGHLGMLHQAGTHMSGTRTLEATMSSAILVAQPTLLYYTRPSPTRSRLACVCINVELRYAQSDRTRRSAPYRRLSHTTEHNMGLQDAVIQKYLILQPKYRYLAYKA